jgi:hypothetical protein
VSDGPIESPRLRGVFLCSAGLMFIAALGLCALLFKMGERSSFADLLVTFAHDPLPLIGPVVLILLGLVLAIQATDLVARFAAVPATLAAHWRGVALGVAIAGFVGSLAVVWVLRAFPNSGDEYEFLFEAETFLARRLWNPLPPFHELFTVSALVDGKWMALYPPGWPLLLAGAKFFHLPTGWFAH